MDRRNNSWCLGQPAIIGLMRDPNAAAEERRLLDAASNESARLEMLRQDARRSLGENLEQADALIRAAFELADGLSAAS